MPGPYEVRPAKDDHGNPTGDFYYVEVGANGEVMNTSQLYPSKAHAERGIKDAIERADDPQEAA